MIRRIITLIHKDARIFLADPVAIGLGFVVPLVMILVFGFVMGGMGGGEIDPIEVLAVNQDEGPAGRRLLNALNALDEIVLIETLRKDTTKLDSSRARQRVAQGKNSVAIIVPRDFSAGLKQGEVRLTILRDPRDRLAGGIVEGMLKQQIFSVFPGVLPVTLMQTSFGADSLQQLGFNSDLRRAIQRNFGVPMPESLSMGQLLPEEMVWGRDSDVAAKTDSAAFGLDAAFERVFQVKSEDVVGRKIVNPGIAQSVAGPAVMFLLFAVGAIAASLLREMRDGTAFRMMVSGVRAGELLFAKYVYAVLLGATQLAIMLVYGRIIFGLNIMGQPLALLLVILSVAAAMSSLGLIISAIGRTEEQATGFQVVVILAMSAIGGAMFPSFMIPKIIRSLAVITPVHWAMQGFLDVFWRDQGLTGVAQECGILLFMAAAMVTISVSLFRRRLTLDLG